MQIIDLHTHMFNSRYVPLNEIMRGKNIPSGISHLLTRLIWAVTRKSKFKDSSFSISSSHTETDSLLDELNEQFADTVMYSIEESLHSLGSEDDIDLVGFYELNDSEVINVLQDINQVYGDAESEKELAQLTNPNFILEQGTAKFINQLQKGLFGGAIKKMIKRLIKKALRFVENAVDLLDFFLTMMRSEKSLLKRLLNYYQDFTNDILLVHHMMDMKAPFNGKVKYNYNKQLARMTALEKYSQGKLIGFSAFDPIRFRNAKADKAAIISHLETALSMNKKGFKFYPPMGYRAAQNEDEELERVIDIFFDYCTDKAIPVFTHCTPEGFEVAKGSGVDSNPDFWAAALAKERDNIDRSQLILCFGHAGGGYRENNGVTTKGWFSESEDEWNDENNYASKVVSLCRQYPNVYCEISYLHEIIHNDNEADKLKKRLITEYDKDREDPVAQYLLQDKLMYGSDWHMPSMVNDVKKYLRRIINMFDTDDLKPYKEMFFHKNAKKYLNM